MREYKLVAPSSNDSFTNSNCCYLQQGDKNSFIRTEYFDTTGIPCAYISLWVYTYSNLFGLFSEENTKIINFSAAPGVNRESDVCRLYRAFEYYIVEVLRCDGVNNALLGEGRSTIFTKKLLSPSRVFNLKDMKKLFVTADNSETAKYEKQEKINRDLSQCLRDSNNAVDCVITNLSEWTPYSVKSRVEEVCVVSPSNFDNEDGACEEEILINPSSLM